MQTSPLKTHGRMGCLYGPLFLLMAPFYLVYALLKSPETRKSIEWGSMILMLIVSGVIWFIIGLFIWSKVREPVKIYNVPLNPSVEQEDARSYDTRTGATVSNLCRGEKMRQLGDVGDAPPRLIFTHVSRTLSA